VEQVCWLWGFLLTTGFSPGFFDDTVNLPTEYWHDTRYNINNSGTGKKLNGLVVQIASEF